MDWIYYTGLPKNLCVCCPFLLDLLERDSRGFDWRYLQSRAKLVLGWQNRMSFALITQYWSPHGFSSVFEPIPPSYLQNPFYQDLAWSLKTASSNFPPFSFGTPSKLSLTESSCLWLFIASPMLKYFVDLEGQNKTGHGITDITGYKHTSKL